MSVSRLTMLPKFGVIRVEECFRRKVLLVNVRGCLVERLVGQLWADGSYGVLHIMRIRIIYVLVFMIITIRSAGGPLHFDRI